MRLTSVSSKSLIVVQKTLDYITESLAKGDKVELRNFGGLRKSKCARPAVGAAIPTNRRTDVPIPARSMVKFKAGKEMRAEVLKLPRLNKPWHPASRPGKIGRKDFPNLLVFLIHKSFHTILAWIDYPDFRDFYPEPLPPSGTCWSADARQHIFDKWRGTGPSLWLPGI